MSQQDKIGRRYNELIADGLTSANACDMIRQEFNITSRDTTIRSYGSRAKVKGDDQATLTELGLPSDDQPVITSEAFTLSPQIIQQLADAIAERLLPSHRVEIPDFELIPTPETISKGGRGSKVDSEQKSYRRLTITLDKKLSELVQVTKKKYGVSESRIIQSCVWLCFGKPKLSFEDD